MGRGVRIGLLWLLGVLTSMAPRCTAATIGRTFRTATVQRQDSLAAAADTVAPARKESYWRRLFYGHEDRTFERRLDVSFAIAPSYAWETGLGIGGMATGLYRLDRTDSLMPPSNVMLSGSVTFRGAYLLAAEGNTYFKGRRSRLAWQLGLQDKTVDFWGIDRASCATNPTINYTRRQVLLQAHYRYEPVRHLFVGGRLDFLSARAAEIDDPAYLQGQRTSYLNTGLGVSLEYDSRDFIPNPRRGLYLSVTQSVWPAAFGDYGRTLWRTTVAADYYQPVWRGGLLAFDLYGRFGSNDLPWTMREQLGGRLRMRGYYEGRYTDNHIVAGQVELRQRITGRLGVVVWYGGGTVFSDFGSLRWGDLLPTYGVGIRFEFKHNINLRVDYGFGRQSGGVVFSMGEAF